MSCGHPNHGSADHNCAPFSAEGPKDAARLAVFDATVAQMTALRAERNAMADHINQLANDWQNERDRAERWETEARILGRNGAEAADLLAAALGYPDRFHTDAPLGTSILLHLARQATDRLAAAGSGVR